MFKQLKKWAVGAILGLLSLQAMATSVLPTDAQTAMTTVHDGATEILAWMWSVGVIVVVGFIAFKLFKKAGNKAT